MKTNLTRILLQIFLYLMLLTPITLSKWSNWTEWSMCSSKCGGGVMSQTRKCLEGQCNGTTLQYRSCSLEACTNKYTDLRDEKCATFDNKFSINGKNLTWQSAKDYKKTCELVCQSNIYIYRPRNINMSGVKCIGHNKQEGICLGNTCIVSPVGCDGELGVSKKLDKCLHCKPYRATNDLCEKFSISLETTSDVPVSSFIPVGATTVTISHVNSVVLGTLSNVIRLPTNSSAFELAGAKFITLNNMSVYTDGPLLKSITVQVKFSSSVANLEYYKVIINDNSSVNETVSYTWQYNDFTQCSVSCGIGLEVSHVYCRDSEFPDKVLPDSFCLNTPKPFPIVRKCSKGVCPPRWVVFEWSICPAICGGGTQRRNVECRQVNGMGLDKKVSDSYCISSLRPIDSQRCNTHLCGTWKVSTWGQCSHSCGIGVRNRSVICIGENGMNINDINCQHLTKPSIIEPCNNGQCSYYWKSEPWSSCNNSCGHGIQRRSVYCVTNSGTKVNDTICHQEKPSTIKTCYIVTGCNTLRWSRSHWGPCEGPCTDSTQNRKVTCEAVVEQQLVELPDNACINITRPTSVRPCNKTRCPSWRVGEWGQCSVTCGKGEKTRKVECVVEGQPSTGCQNKPNETIVCEEQPCTGCVDKPGYNCVSMKSQFSCELVVMKLYCCKTCSIN